MAQCSYCSRSGFLLRTNAYGLCKPCRGKVQLQTEAERERIKGDLISARYLKDPGLKLRHLQSALDGTMKLFRYERLGCSQSNPSPRALKGFLEEKLREAASEDHPLSVQTAEPPWESSLPGDSAREMPATPGTRRVPRHAATLGVWMDQTTPARTEDVSPQGVRVRSAALLKPGTRVGVTLEAPEGALSGEGMVRWARRAVANGKASGQALMGVEFLTPLPELQHWA